jgi:hypothetical protein
MYAEQCPNDGTVQAKSVLYSDLNLNIYASSLLFVDVIAYGALIPFGNCILRREGTSER